MGTYAYYWYHTTLPIGRTCVMLFSDQHMMHHPYDWAHIYKDHAVDAIRFTGW